MRWIVMRTDRRKYGLLLVAGVVGLGGMMSMFGKRQTTVSAASGTPVLVELFTSEGCSSCPPADALLAKLDAAQPVSGARVIVLSEHVTYWNSLGWRDPFSADAMTQRQQRYGERFGLNSVYTPQAVVDGAAQLVGSDERGLTRAVAKAAAAPKVELTIADARLDGDAVRFSVKASAAVAGSTLMAALAEDGVQSNVLRGENGGRTLKHVAVVRTLQDMGSGAADGRALMLKTSGANGGGAMRLVVFLADHKSGRVVALAEQTLRQ